MAPHYCGFCCRNVMCLHVCAVTWQLHQHSRLVADWDGGRCWTRSDSYTVEGQWSTVGEQYNTIQ